MTNKWHNNFDFFVNRTLQFELYEALDTLIDMAYNTDNIVNNCYQGVLESKEVLIAKSEIFMTPRGLIENVIH